MQTYTQQAQKASPRGRGTAAPLKGGMSGHGAPGMPANGYPPGAAKMTAGASASRPEGPVDYEFLDLISEILQLVEQGFSTNSEVVKDKVNKLQEKFARAKVALERMDGAEMTPRMQEEMFDLYVIAHCPLLCLAAHSFTWGTNTTIQSVLCCTCTSQNRINQLDRMSHQAHTVPRTRTLTHAHTHTDIYTHKRTQSHMHTHTGTHKHTYTHKHRCYTPFLRHMH